MAGHPGLVGGAIATLFTVAALWRGRDQMLKRNGSIFSAALNQACSAELYSVVVVCFKSNLVSGATDGPTILVMVICSKRVNSIVDSSIVVSKLLDAYLRLVSCFFLFFFILLLEFFLSLLQRFWLLAMSDRSHLSCPVGHSLCRLRH